MRPLAGSEYEPGSLGAVPEAEAPPPSLSPRPFHSLAGAVNELPGPKQGLALRRSQGALGSQNPQEVLRRENTGKARLECAQVCPAPSAGGQSKTPSSGSPTSQRPSHTLGSPPRSRGHAGPPPWPPAPAAPGSAARSPAAPGRCRRVSAPNGHAALAPGSGPWGPGSPCLPDPWTFPATARGDSNANRAGAGQRGGARPLAPGGYAQDGACAAASQAASRLR